MCDKLAVKSKLVDKIRRDGIFSAKKELPIKKKIDDDAVVEIWLVWDCMIIVKGREKSLTSSDDEGVDMSCSKNSKSNLI